MKKPKDEVIVPEVVDDTADKPGEGHGRFYDRLRKSINRSIGRRGGVAGKAAEFLMFVPDVFVLLWRLVKDSRVSKKDKVLLVTAIVYFVMPFDLLPEAFAGGIGYLDDLIFAAYVLNGLLTTTDPAVLREHWSGRDDVLEIIQRVLREADSLVGSKIAGKLKSMVGR